jgi:hypothetical protein
MDMVSKRQSLLTLLVGIGLFLLSSFSREIGFCLPYSYSKCAAFFDGFAEMLLPIFPMLLFSLITYRMTEEIYTAWFKFARWWIPFSMFAIFLAPEYSSNFMSPIEKGTVALTFSALFVIISAIIVGTKYFRRK